MKIEEAKALFVAQYIWQMVYMSDKIKDYETQVIMKTYLVPSLIDQHEPEFLKQGVLLLRSVNQLTDEEILIITQLLLADYLDFQKKVYYTHFEIKRFVGFIQVQNKHGYEVKIWDSGKIQVSYQQDNYINNAVQTLIRFGVLLPFTYLNEENKPVTLQPDDIIELGWAKYQTT